MKKNKHKSDLDVTEMYFLIHAVIKHCSGQSGKEKNSQILFNEAGMPTLELEKVMVIIYDNQKMS